VSRASQAFDRGRVSVRGKSAESGAPVHFDLVEQPCGLVRCGQADASFVGPQAYLGMQKEQIDAFDPQPLEAGFENRAQRTFRLDHVHLEEADLRANQDLIPHAEFANDSAQVRFRKPITVVRGSVEVRDASIHGTLDRPALLARLAPVHESASRPAAEAER
jgi:hypothetical protein